MIRPRNTGSPSKSSLNSSSNSTISAEISPRSILRKRQKRYNNNNENYTAVTAAAGHKYKRHSHSRSRSSKSTRTLYDDNRQHEGDDVLNENEETLIQTSPSTIIRNKLCGALFPLLDPNNNNNNSFLDSKDQNNNEFSDDKCPGKGGDEENNSNVIKEPKQRSRNDTLVDGSLGSKSEEKRHPTRSQDGSKENKKLNLSTSGASVKKPSEKKPKTVLKGVLRLPDYLHFKIFSYLNRIDIHTCTQVCRLWKEYCDTFYNAPHVFNGRSAFWNLARSKETCRDFLANCLLAPDTRRHFKLYFYNVLDWQMKTITEESPKDFSAGVKHISRLHLVNCNLHWNTLVTLLLSLHHLHTFTDTWSCHYQYSTLLTRLNTKQGSLKKLDEKLSFINELKNRHTRIRVFKLSRRSLTKELCVYFHVIPKLVPYLEEFEFNIGPWETPKRELPTVLEWLEEFGKSFKMGMRLIRKYLKRLRINWNDNSLESLFDKFVNAIYALEFPKLAEITIRMSGSSMKYPGTLPEFVRFINSFEWKEKAKPPRHMLLKAYLAPIYLTEEWAEFLCTLQDRIIRRKLRVSLRFEVRMDDSIMSVVDRQRIEDVFRNFVFFRGLTKLQVKIQSVETQSLRSVIPRIRTIYPNIKSLNIKIQEGDSGLASCFTFRDYSVISIAFNFKFITELRISDQSCRKWDVLDRVLGRKRASLTYAYITSNDMTLLCETLTRLKVLQLWANLNDLCDINFTGIKRRYYYYCPRDGNFYLKSPDVLKERREPSIYSLKNLQLLSLRGLGRDVTDITCRFAFQGMNQLRYIELTGDTNITQKGRKRLHSRMRLNNCKVCFCR